MFWFLPLLIGLGIWSGYRFSPAYSAMLSARVALDAAEALAASASQARSAKREALQAAAATFRQAVHEERLRALPIEVLKRHAPGLRLQALRDAGLTNLSGLQGWNESRIAQVRGVGPKSASLIVPLVRTLSDSARAVPLVLPCLPFGSKQEAALLLATHEHLVCETLLDGSAEAWERVVSTERAKLDETRQFLRFLTWFRSWGRSLSIVDAVALAKSIADALASSGERQVLEVALDESRNQPTASAAVIAAYRENPDQYDDVLASALGLSRKPSLAARKAVLEEQHGESECGGRIHDESTMKQMPEAQSIEAVPEDAEATADVNLEVCPGSVINSGMVRDDDGEELSAMDVGEIASNAGSFTLPRPVPATFSRLVQGPVTGLTKSTQSAAELLQVFSMSKSRAQSYEPQLRWVPAGEAVTIQGFTIERGMVYCGPQKDFGHMQGIIHPQQAVRRRSTASPLKQHSYVSSYGSLSPDGRSWFLEWLADGARDTSQPAAALLYFYGLERRLLQHATTLASDGAQVLHEVQRLAGIFKTGWTQVSFSARRLADFIAARDLGDVPASELPAMRERTYELPLILRHGLGCFSRDGVPVPVAWMLRWVYQEPNLHLRTPATRCTEAFEQAFTHRYREKCGDGLVISPGKSLLKISYNALDYLLRGPATERAFAGIPDVADAPAEREFTHYVFPIRSRSNR